MPEVYVIKTGGLSLGSSRTIKGDGVTIVLLDPTGVVDVGNKGSLQLKARSPGCGRESPSP